MNLDPTKLKWTADIGECARVRDSENALIATCHYINADSCRRDSNDVADYARLLAAAPELLVALEILYDKYENGTSCYEDPEDCAGYVGNAVRLSVEEEDKILAAFEKAGMLTALSASERIAKLRRD